MRSLSDKLGRVALMLALAAAILGSVGSTWLPNASAATCYTGDGLSSCSGPCCAANYSQCWAWSGPECGPQEDCSSNGVCNSNCSYDPDCQDCSSNGVCNSNCSYDPDCQDCPICPTCIICPE